MKTSSDYGVLAVCGGVVSESLFFSDVEAYMMAFWERMQSNKRR